jgi:hypothetical protein
LGSDNDDSVQADSTSIDVEKLPDTVQAVR